MFTFDSFVNRRSCACIPGRTFWFMTGQSIELEKETVGGVARLQAHQTQSNSDRFLQHFGQT